MSNITLSEIGVSAKGYLNMGISVIPIQPCSKRPYCAWNIYKSRSATPLEIEKWWPKGSHRNIAAVTGKLKNGKAGSLVIFDFDGKNRNIGYLDFVKRFPFLKNTVHVTTASGGHHIWAIFPTINKNITKIIKEGKGYHIEFRCNNHYTIIPPSSFPNIGRYSFSGDIDILILETEQEKTILDYFQTKSKSPQIEEKPQKKNPQKKIQAPTLAHKLKLAIDVLNRAISRGEPSKRNDVGFWLAKRFWEIGLTKDEAEPFMRDYQRSVDKPDNKYSWGEATATLISAYKDMEPLRCEKYIFTIDELIARDIPQPNFLISPWLYFEGITMIYGEKGVGKTFLSLFLSIMVAGYTDENGEPLTISNWKAKEHTGVLFVDGEMSTYMLKQRMMAMTKKLKAPKNDIVFLTSCEKARMGDGSLNLNMPEDRKMITDYLKQHPEIGFIVFDNYSALTTGLNENDASHWDPIKDWFLMLRFMKKAVVLNHHSGKDEKKGPRGTSRMSDMMDCTIKLKKPDDYESSDMARLVAEFDKNPRMVDKDGRLSSFEFQIKPNGENCDVTWKDCSTSSKKDNIKAMLLDGMMQKDITSEFNVAKSYVSKIKKDLIKYKYLTPAGTITQKGKEWLDDYKKRDENMEF